MPAREIVSIQTFISQHNFLRSTVTSSSQLYVIDEFTRSEFWRLYPIVPATVVWDTVLQSYRLDGMAPPPLDIAPNPSLQVSVSGEDGIAPTTRSCACESCKYLRKDPTAKLKRGTVHNYSYKPRVWKMHKVAGDDDDMLFGIELETDAHSVTSSEERLNSPLTNPQAVDMRRPKRLWVAKSDASVSGPEFVSHPATLGFWQAKSGDVKDMFRMLLHAGFRSHDNDNCGMHVNINRDAIPNADVLFRFLTLIHYSPDWSTAMAQRTTESVNHWAQLRGLETAEARFLTSMEAFQSTFYATTDKYSALNIPARAQGRFEFRLPRGTLRIDRFMKNIEWTHAMVSFARALPNPEDCVPSVFTEWVNRRDDKYPNLASFMNERKVKLTGAFDRNTLLPLFTFEV